MFSITRLTREAMTLVSSPTRHVIVHLRKACQWDERRRRTAEEGKASGGDGRGGGAPKLLNTPQKTISILVFSC